MDDQVHAVAERAGLGRHQGTHRPTERSSGVVGGIVCTPLFALFGFGSLFSGGPLFLTLLFIPLAVGFGILTVCEGYRALNMDRVRADFFDNGLVYVNHAGRPSAIRWDSVEVIQNFSTVRSRHMPPETRLNSRLRTPDGTKAKISSSHAGQTGMDEWGRLLQESVAKAQLPDAVAQFNNGEPVRLGDVVISRDGLSWKSRSWTWDRIEHVEVLNGRVLVQEPGSQRRRLFTEVSRIPNFSVFTGLVRLVLQTRQRGHRGADQ